MDYKQLTLESFEYIKNNLDVNSNLVPKKFVDYWLVPDYDSLMLGQYVPKEDDEHHTVFMFALLKSLERNHYEYEMPADKMFKLFFQFQTILAMRQLSEISDMKTEGFRIFDFEHYDTFKIRFISSRGK